MYRHSIARCTLGNRIRQQAPGITITTAALFDFHQLLLCSITIALFQMPKTKIGAGKMIVRVKHKRRIISREPFDHSARATQDIAFRSQHTRCVGFSHGHK